MDEKPGELNVSGGLTLGGKCGGFTAKFFQLFICLQNFKIEFWKLKKVVSLIQRKQH